MSNRELDNREMSNRELDNILTNILSIKFLASCRLCGKTLSQKQTDKGKKYCRRCARAKSKQKLGRVSK